MELPQELKTAIEEELASLPGGTIREAATQLSDRYRAGDSTGAGFRSNAEIAAYAAYRLPATYVAVHSVFKEAAEWLGAFSPLSLLDVGAGPGTATWAAACVWPGLETATLIEREAEIAKLGQRLASHLKPSALSTEWLHADLTGQWKAGQHDVVVVSYSLGEVPQSKRENLLRRLWELAGKMLVVVEPGTQAGFACVHQARETLLSLGAKMLAPCPHAGPCPMEHGNWCHFSARVARSRPHRNAKGAELSYEDEKFSYAAFAKFGEASACKARVLRHPQARKGHLQLELCTSTGLRSVIVSRSQGAVYKTAKDLKWGSSADEIFNNESPI